LNYKCALFSILTRDCPIPYSSVNKRLLAIGCREAQIVLYRAHALD
jgi:hypothetical protein